MKELSIEEKAKAYDEAIEKIKYVMEHGVSPVLNKEDLQDIFPELQKSEDEKIRKALIDGFTVMKESKNCGKTFSNHNIPVTDILAWLEKQDESGTFNIPQTPIKDAVEVTSRMQFISDDMKPIAEFIMGYANWDLHKDEWNQPTLTVPLFRVLDALIQRGKPYGECSQNIEKQGEQETDEWKEGNIIRHGGILALVIRGRRVMKSNGEIFTVQYPDEWVKAAPKEIEHFLNEFEKQGEQPQGKTALEAAKQTNGMLI